jgi:hypothetical protein
MCVKVAQVSRAYQSWVNDCPTTRIQDTCDVRPRFGSFLVI